MTFRKQAVDGSPDSSASFTRQPAVSLATTAGSNSRLNANACSCIASADIQPTHPPGIKGRYREWCAATQSSARAGGRQRVARECNSSGPRVLPPGAQPRLSQCGSRGLCAFNPYVSLNTTIAIYVGSAHAKSHSGREAEQPRGVETTLSSDGQFCYANTCVCGTRRRRYRVRRA